MNASSIIMALEEFTSEKEERSSKSYKFGCTLAQSWPLLLTPDTELDIVYTGLKRMRQIYVSSDRKDWDAFLSKTTDDSVLGYLLYYAEMNCPEQTDKILSLERSRFILDGALQHVKAFDTLLHTDMGARVKAKIDERVTDYKTLKVLSIDGKKSVDAKLRCKTFLCGGNFTYTLAHLINDVKSIPQETFDLIVDHTTHAPKEKDTIDICIPVKMWKNILSPKLQEQVKNTMNTNIRPIWITFTVKSKKRGVDVVFDLTDYEAKCEQRSWNNGMKSQRDAQIHKEVTAYLTSVGFPPSITLKGHTVMQNDVAYGGIPYVYIEKEMTRILDERAVAPNECDETNGK